MEGSAYVEPTVALYESPEGEPPNGRHRHPGVSPPDAADLRACCPSNPRSGSSRAPTTSPRRSPTAKHEVDAAYQSLALLLAESAATGATRCALGTHDSDLIERIATFAEAAGVPRDRLQVHMLYGIRADELRRLAAAGYPTYTLIAYGEHWYPWYMRRLAERPANVVFALRQMLP